MDQDAFRQLLSVPKSSSSASGAARRNIQTIDASQPIFKPRKAATKSNAKHAGLGFKGSTTARAVLDEYAEKPFAGFDLAAIEKERMKASASANDDMDDVLEQTYQGVTTNETATSQDSAAVPKKRTREEIVNELKYKRQKTKDEGADKALDDAKKAGKFRPIGAPEPKVSVKKVKAGSDRKPKRKRAANETETSGAAFTVGTLASTSTQNSSVPDVNARQQRPCSPPPEIENDGIGDSDIFADIQEYKGLDDDDDDDDDAEDSELPAAPSQPPMTAAPVQWFQFGEEGETSMAMDLPPSPPVPSSSLIPERKGSPHTERLAPLASSSFSIKDVLAMDKELEKEEKRKARKDKKKKAGEDGPSADKKKLSGEAKATRDLQKLESYAKKRT